jgi:hypothetical protein
MNEAATGVDRRLAEQGDRRKRARNGRRSGDPHAWWRWRRIAWLFGVYATYLGVRSLPSTIQRRFKRVQS